MIGLLCLAGCRQADWRADAATAAEANIRALIDAPDARFSHVQVTGDDRTGQTCGTVIAGDGAARRFIVYIDGSAGPFVESTANEGMRARFAADWAADCLREGYSA